MPVVKRKQEGDEGFAHPALAVEDEEHLANRRAPWRVSTSDELLPVDIGGIEMEASCIAGAWKLAGAGRAVTGFGPGRLLNGPWGWVVVSLLCSRWDWRIADELAVAHAEAASNSA